ncbi:MAG: metal ABC transporter permease, partial [Chlamydiae bacterium]|nr:metal ABC transporter permease [Chlamydiota bacterium]
MGTCKMIEYFFGPILRAPTWGCILMCLSSSLMGVIVFLRKKSLLAESLSHASYPGIVMGIFLLATLFPEASGEWTFLAVLFGALLTSFLALRSIEWLERRGKVFPDAALCFVLSVFFGSGIVFASGLQGSHPSWFKQMQMLLFGQVATMRDAHIAIYGFLALLVCLFLATLYRPLQAILFDSGYAKSLGMRVKSIDRLFYVLLLFSIIVSLRSVGVVLMSGMLIAPAVAARQYTNRLATMFWLAGFFGILSAFLGYVLSVEGSSYASSPELKISLPTGP